MVLVHIFLIILFINRVFFEIYFHRSNEAGNKKVILKFDVHLVNHRDNAAQIKLFPGKNHNKNNAKEMMIIDQIENGFGRIEHNKTNTKENRTKTSDKIIDTSKVDVPSMMKSQSKTKYLFALRYYEQLSMATNNFLSLASLATATGRCVVEPFVNNSRFSGLPSGVSNSRFRESSNKFSRIDQYFDRESLKYLLETRGYNKMISLNEYKEACDNIDLVVHFLYNDSNSNRDLRRWYKLSDRDIDVVNTKVRHIGVMECDFIEKSGINKFLGNKPVKKHLCVHPDLINSNQKFQSLVLKDSKCSVVTLWKGNGTKRTHFELAQQITAKIKPFEIKHSKTLIDIAHDYIRNTIKRPYIAVHARVERHVKWKGVHTALSCIRKVSANIEKRKTKLNLKKIFLAHDLGQYGSDTLQRTSNKTSLLSLEKELTLGLMNPFRFNPKKYGLYDRGSIAIVEMHIMSLGESLFTLGKGNFQDWVINLFLQKNAEDRSLVHKICDSLERTV